MILSAHILIGATLATKISSPFLGFLFAFLSHYFFDALPTREYSISNIRNKNWKRAPGDFLKVFLDIFLGFFLVFILSKNILFGILGGFLAILPDGLTFLLLIFPKVKFLNSHHQIHVKFNWFKISEVNPVRNQEFLNGVNPVKNQGFLSGINKKIPLFWMIFSQLLIFFIFIFLLLSH